MTNEYWQRLLTVRKHGSIRLLVGCYGSQRDMEHGMGQYGQKTQYKHNFQVYTSGT